MAITSEQIQQWGGDFGAEYTRRNSYTLSGMEEHFRGKFGLSRTELNWEFWGDLERSIKILEAGANIGLQLECLQKMGFENLYGLELQFEAVKLAQKRTPKIKYLEASIFEIPFKEGSFDLVFTSGVLIHLHPQDLKLAMKELYRISRRFILGFEYYHPEIAEVNYRGHSNLLWKADYGHIYQQNHPDLKLVKKRLVKYLDNENKDLMFLLQK
jgi:pseudaminic acid biosynthesis-associated methylase